MLAMTPPTHEGSYSGQVCSLFPSIPWQHMYKKYYHSTPHKTGTYYCHHMQTLAPTRQHNSSSAASWLSQAGTRGKTTTSLNSYLTIKNRKRLNPPSSGSDKREDSRLAIKANIAPLCWFSSHASHSVTTTHKTFGVIGLGLLLSPMTTDSDWYKCRGNSSKVKSS